MYILKKLNREKRVRTAEESAALQGKGWKLIQEKKSFEKPGIDEIADGLSRKLQEEMKAVEESQEQEPEEKQEQEGEAEPEGSQEQESEAEPEEKPKKSRTKAKE